MSNRADARSEEQQPEERPKELTVRMAVAFEEAGLTNAELPNPRKARKAQKKRGKRDNRSGDVRRPRNKEKSSMDQTQTQPQNGQPQATQSSAIVSDGVSFGEKAGYTIGAVLAVGAIAFVGKCAFNAADAIFDRSGSDDVLAS